MKNNKPKKEYTLEEFKTLMKEKGWKFGEAGTLSLNKTAKK